MSAKRVEKWMCVWVECDGRKKRNEKKKRHKKKVMRSERQKRVLTNNVEQWRGVHGLHHHGATQESKEKKEHVGRGRCGEVGLWRTFP